MTIVVGTTEAQTRFAELLIKAERGEEILIAREGEPVAVLRRAEAQAESKTIDRARLRRIADRFVEHFGRPFQSTDIDQLLYDEDGLPK